MKLLSAALTSSLRSKVLGLALFVSAAFAAGSWAMQRWIVQPEFARIELRESDQNLSRVHEGIRRDGEALARASVDYAAWDETLAFVRHPNPHYLEANLIPQTLVNVATDLALIRDGDGRVVFAEGLDESRTAFTKIPEIVEVLTRDAAPLFEHDGPSSLKSGLVVTPKGILLVGASAITDNAKQAPASGTFLFGRFLDAAEIEKLADRTRVPLTLDPLGAIPDRDRPAAAALASGAPSWQDASDPSTLIAYARIPDVAGRPALLLRVALPRPTSEQAAAAGLMMTLASVCGSTVLLAVMWFVLASVLVRPLERVTAHAVRVGADADLGARLDLRSHDEIGTLAREFDAMVARLEASRIEKVDLAHRAGRAQVARMVLHDIGNVLNNMRVGASVVSDTLARSDLGDLRRLVDLLRPNAERLPDFFASDPRGRSVLPFLEALTNTLESEQRKALDELKDLGAAIDHVGALVRSQNGEASARPLLEPIEPSAIAEQAAAFASESFARHGIVVERIFPPLPRAWIDRHRCVQILVNLLTNAKNAICDARRGGGRIELAVRAASDADGDWLEYSILDDGVGFEPDDREKLFSFGFSTRADGQGIGLHSGANLARELGGSLLAESAGPDRGARFTLRIPFHRSPA